MMMESGEIESADDEMPSLGRQQYRPVVSHEGSAVQIQSMESRSFPEISLKPIRTASHTENAPNTLEGPSHGPDVPNNFPRESKLELFGFDSLVNILGLKSMTGEHVPTPTSPRDGDEVSVVLGSPKSSPIFSMSSISIALVADVAGKYLASLPFQIRIVGMAGIGEGLLLVAFCGCCTFLTSISLSAIATNGAMKGGGPYYLIGRALGPEVGVSIGLCFFLGTAVAGAMYVLGAVETFLDAVPGAGFFRETVTLVSNSTAANGTTTEVITMVSTPSLHDLQVYGVVVAILLCFIVFGGVKMINRVAPAFLIPVLFSLFCIYIGIFSASRSNDSSGITGLRSQTFKDNWSSDYQFTTNAGIPDPEGPIYWNFK
ncbi:hypothetical protein ZIOFF_043168 [Zingiber officinale]|uniref:Amino acid permease/ SLC12A domain-containing protein n=1 Tax=Zingiber officinale TaxID=94328 RepID=A0A8J5FST8_ZINOF|nr:hypothetical protein ZIOFF_043168 [Zingiber officinale]